MMLAWMLYTLLVGCLLAIAAKGLSEVCGLFRLPARFIWLSALVAMVALSALAPLRATFPASPAPVSALDPGEDAHAGADADAGAEAGASAGATGLRALQSRIGDAVGPLRDLLARPLRAAANRSGDRSVAIGAGLVWLTFSLALLSMGAATVLRYRRARRQWPVARISGNMVRVAPAAGPAVLGILRPEIIVPTWLLNAPAEAQRLVVLHEREHVRARDPLTLAAGSIAAALVPWNPVAWWMLQQLRLSLEVDCDARVLGSGVRPKPYGSVLIDMAGHGTGLSLGVPAFAGSRSILERRLIAMTTRLSRAASLRAFTLGAVGVLALLVACDARMPSDVEVEQMDATAAEARAQELGLLQDGNVVFYLDGERVSSEEARAVSGERIAHVEISRIGDGSAIHLSTGERSSDSPQVEEIVVRPEFGRASDTFQGLHIVDGEVVSNEQMRTFDPDAIESIEVVKGAAATRMYDDPRAAHGVIRITMKDGATP